MTNEKTAKAEDKAIELQDEQLDNVAGGANLKVKSSPDNFRADGLENPTLSSKKLYNDAAG